jgi:regulator of sirC expression with transglutaminase-like and TPR domain
MDPILLVDLQRRLAEYKLCESAILLNQSYTIKDRSFTRADLGVVQKAINDLQSQIDAINNGGGTGIIRTKRVVMRD